MSEELKPCHYCGKPAFRLIKPTDKIWCLDINCPNGSSNMTFEQWQNFNLEIESVAKSRDLQIRLNNQTIEFYKVLDERDSLRKQLEESCDTLRKARSIIDEFFSKAEISRLGDASLPANSDDL